MVIPAQFLNQNFHEIFVYHFLKMEGKEYIHALLAILCATAKRTGIAYADSTPIPICHNKRTSRHWKSAQKGKKIWFFNIFFNFNGHK
ncbi:MAG: hypothetical protein CNLJKLNK_00564 [Holosporales bacterium]